MKRTVAVLATAVWTLAATVALPQPAAAAPTTCEGVWVVVDATALGGSVNTACAPSHATGTAALASAGFSVARSSSMLCQIDSLPERCEVSASAYWSYWQSEPEGDGYGDWVYANLGPDAYRPRGGDAEGWVFGDGRTPPAAFPETLAVGSATPAPDATPGQPVPSAPADAAPAGAGAGAGAGGPVGVAVVAGAVLVAGAGVWLARRRAR